MDSTMDWAEWTDQYLGFKGRSPEELKRNHPLVTTTRAVPGAIASLVFLAVTGQEEKVVAKVRVIGQHINGSFLTLYFEGAEIEYTAVIMFFELRGFKDECLIRGTISGPDGWGALRLSVGRPSPRMMGIRVYAGECINITNLRFDLSK